MSAGSYCGQLQSSPGALGSRERHNSDFCLEDNRWLISAIQPRQQRFDVFIRRLMSLYDARPPNRLRLRQTWSRDVNRVSVLDGLADGEAEPQDRRAPCVKSRNFQVQGSQVKSRLMKIKMAGR